MSYSCSFFVVNKNFDILWPVKHSKLTQVASEEQTKSEVFAHKKKSSGNVDVKVSQNKFTTSTINLLHI